MPNKIENLIGQVVMVNGRGDLAMTQREWVNQEAIFLKITKAGLAHIQSVENPKRQTSVPLKNITLEN